MLGGVSEDEYRGRVAEEGGKSGVTKPRGE